MTRAIRLRDARGGHVSWSAFTVFATALSCALLGYDIARAATVPLTYDEAVTYQWYIDAGPLAVWNTSIATNHLLNTVLTRLAVAAAGDHEVVLRLANLFGHTSYLLFSSLLTHALPSRAIAVAGFALLNMNPYLVEYFSLSRGYGLSLGLLMGALYFLVRLLTSSDTSGSACRHLARSLVFAGAAVTANFALLSVYLALWTVGLAVGVARRVRDTDPIQQVRPQLSTERRGREWLWLSVTAVVFTALVLSQYTGLSSTLYEPVSVRIVGLFDQELDAIAVERLDTTARWRPLSREGDTWRTERPLPVAGLRLELPPAAAHNLALIAVTIGSTTFRHERRSAGPWRARDVGGARVMESEPGLSLSRATVPAMRGAINWAGDKRQVMCVAAGAGTVLLGLCILARALGAARRVLDRYQLLGSRPGSVLSRGILWIAVVVAAPGYVLTAGGELYFGGHEGLVRDTYTSLIANSFHGATYHPRQIALVLAAIAASVAGFAVVAAVYGRRSRSELLAVAVMIKSLFLILSAIILLQHALLGTPFLMGRTALFHIPLYSLFLVFASAAAATLHRWARAIVVPTLAGVALLAAIHFALTANITYVFDGPREADTRQMISDLRSAIAASPSDGSRTRLAVDSIFYPCAVFYAKRDATSAIDVVVTPAEQPVDYLYVERGNLGTEGRVVARYTRTGSVLLKAARE